jgi:cation:H+ antiporter
MMAVWLQFILCTAVILFSGSRLSRYGDVISEKTGMGRTWTGIILMASMTSLPELVTGVSSVSIYALPNIAVGDVLGSCMFNLLILAALDVGRRRAPIASRAHQGHALTASFGIFLLGVTAISILSDRSVPAVGWVGASSLLLLLLYLIAVRIVFRYERRRIAEFLAEAGEEARYSHISTSTAYFRFTVLGLLSAGAAIYLPHVGGEITAMTGLSGTFVGSIFIALSTSLPEIVTTRTALKMQAVDLAVGNILGSNLFNLLILAIDDFFYLRGPLLSHVSQSNAITAIAAMAMTALVSIALVYRSPRKAVFLSWDSLGIIFTYVVSVLILLLQR